MKNLATRKRYKNLSARSRTDLGRFADTQLNMLLNIMGHSGIEQDARSFEFADGSRVDIYHSYGLSYVDISTPDEVLEEDKKLDLYITIMGKYYIEVADPDFTYYQVPSDAEDDAPPAQNGHKFFWVFPGIKNIREYVIVHIKNSKDATSDEIELAIEEEIQKLDVKTSVKDGVTYAAVEFSVEDIKRMFPVSSAWSDGDAAHGRTNFREAKSFVIERDGTTDRYVGYCSGVLRKANGEVVGNMFDSFGSHVATKRKYHQFHIIQGYYVWFGMGHEAEPGYPDWVNLNVKVAKDDGDDVGVLYTFSKFDYLDILSTYESEIFCDGPVQGNVIGYLRPPAYIDHVAAVLDNSITIIAKGEHGLGSLCGGNDYEDYGCGSGSYIEMTFDASGEQTAGNRSFGFTDYLWGKLASDRRGAIVLADSSTASVDDLEEDPYQVSQETSVDFKSEMLISYRFIKNRFSESTRTVDSIVYDSVDRGFIQEADAEHTPRWTPVKLGSNAFSLNDIDHCAYKDEVRRYEPARKYTIHAMDSWEEPGYCSSGYTLWTSGNCSSEELYALRDADGGPGNIRTGSEWTASPPEYWYYECDAFGLEIAEYVDLPLDRTGVWSCYDTYAYCHEKHTLCVTLEDPSGIPPGGVGFRVDINNEFSEFMTTVDLTYGTTMPTSMLDMVARIHGPADIDWGARTTDLTANDLLVNDTNGAVERIWTQPSEQTPNKTIIYIDASTTKTVGRIWQGSKQFWENYQYAYAFLDNRADDDTALIFVGLGEINTDTPNQDRLLGWDITYLDSDNMQHDIEEVIYALFGIVEPGEILDMGLV